MVEKENQIKKPWISETTFALIREKHWLQQQGRTEDYRSKNKEVRRATKQDWHKWLQNITDAELDLRDKWLGIKYIKQKKAPKLFERAKIDGSTASIRQQADASADYLQEKQWGDTDTPTDETRTKKQNRVNAVFDCSSFMISELVATVKRLKKNKASGPDEIPIEFFKWLDDENLGRVLGLINSWWDQGVFPVDKLQAYFASIYKKGTRRNKRITDPFRC